MKVPLNSVHLDFHTMPNIEDFSYDAEKTARMLSEAGVGSVNIFLQDNQGYCFYPTVIGTRYPYLRDDMFGNLLSECHERGIKVFAYLNIALNYELCHTHPEYMRLDECGNDLIGNDETEIFCRRMCPNTGYGDYIASLLEEAVSLYDFDGFFADNMLSVPCWCEKCKKDMTELGIDIENPCEVEKFAHSNIIKSAKRFRKILPEDKLFFIKGMKYYEMAELCDFAYVVQTEQEGDFELDWCTEARYASNFLPIQYLAGRFVKGWGDFGGYKGGKWLLHDARSAGMLGCGYCLGDHMHPRYGLNERIYYDLSFANKALCDMADDLKGCEIKYDGAILLNREKGIGKEQKGAAKILNELKISYNIVDEFADIDSYGFIIVPENFVIDEDFKQKLENYDGKIISSGSGAIYNGSFALERYHCEYCGKDVSDNGYYGENSVSFYYGGILMNSSEHLYDYVAPYNEVFADGVRPYAYTPNKNPNGRCAVNVGDGCAHICFDIFRAYYDYCTDAHRELISELIERLGIEKSVLDCDLPLYANVAYFEGKEKSVVCIDVNRAVSSGKRRVCYDTVELCSGHKIKVCGEFKYALCNDSTVNISRENGTSTIILPNIVDNTRIILRNN